MQDLLRQKLLMFIWCGVQGATLWGIWKTTQHLKSFTNFLRCGKFHPKLLEGETDFTFLQHHPWH